ncbi:MAG: cation:proton antiporter [Bacteroidales bacterium]|nr:cation:proton antiporter [Bacteroidales bacterium]
MESLPPLFSDLALILVTAGITTIIFKLLKQPVVLGYIVAGFLIGPAFNLFPGITDVADINVWGKIGVVFLLFALGLEFSFKRLKQVGATGAITAITELVIMFTVGFTIGKIIGWQDMNCIFLGCMLSISSTTIIIKAFEDLNMKRHKFTNIVFGVLVVEDLVAVLLLVMLSTVSVSKTFDGGELVFSLLKLMFYLIVWFVVGIYLIPTILQKSRRLMSEETLLVFAIGLCFGMVYFATKAGFSEALGAFMMGSILAETIEADKIHTLVNPIKNLFGAIFFVTVGMLIDPHVLLQYWLPIVVITLAVMFVKSFSATVGVLVSGQDLKTSMQAGFCFSQIGEFSFIIASLGLSFKVIDPFLYPVIVSVSIITTFFTPFFMRLSVPVYNKIYPRLPEKVKLTLDRYSSGAKSAEQENTIRAYVKAQVGALAIYGSILIALFFVSKLMLKPFIITKIDGVWGGIAGAVITLLVMAPFLRALISKKNKAYTLLKKLLQERKINYGLLVSLSLLRYVAAMYALGSVITTYFNLASGYIIAIVFLAFIVIRNSKSILHFYQHIESRFMHNLNVRQEEKKKQSPVLIPEQQAKNFYLEEMVISSDSELVGKTLLELQLREKYEINIVSIMRGKTFINLPSRQTVLYPADKITIVGSDENVTRMKALVEKDDDLIKTKEKRPQMDLYSLQITEGHAFFNKSINDSKIRTVHQALVIAIERDNELLMNPESTEIMQLDDIIWFVCEQSRVKNIMAIAEKDVAK